MFTLRQEHKWLFEEVDNMIPYERDIYIAQLNMWIKKKNEEIEKKKA
jgi:hypothetical protein